MSKLLSFVWILLFLFTGVVNVDALTLKTMLPRSGQTTCYDAGSQIDCAGTGQDGEIQAGVSWPVPRFTVGVGAEADCVTDNLTGLTWMKMPNYPEVTWQQALDFAETSALCGFTDWRVPSVLELESLVHMGYYEETCAATPCGSNAEWLESQGFVQVRTGLSQYWSSSSRASDYSHDHAWIVNMDIGYINVQDKAFSGGSYYKHVWLVRDSGLTAPAKVWRTGQKTCYDTDGVVVTCSGTGQDGEFKPGVAWPNPRFTNNGDGTVTDNLTGLIWLKNANCFGGQTWADALTSALGLSSGSCGLTDGSDAGDWRLPNKTELLSLLDYEYSGPALSNAAGDGKWTAGNAFDNYSGVNLRYWSSSAFGAWDGYPVYVRVGVGDVLYDTSDPYGALNLVWPVRSIPYRNLVVQKESVNFGSGVVISDPSGLDCGPDCSVYFPYGKAVSLMAVPNPANTVFNGWGNSSDADCTDGKLSMYSNRNCTARFQMCILVDEARLDGGTTYSLDEAYNHASSLPWVTNTIELVGYNRNFPDGYDFDADKRVILKGGLNCSYGPVTGAFTYFTGGPFIISDGTVTFDRIVLM
jgi:hypothetical protein